MAHGQQGGSDTQRSPASQETRAAWYHHVHPTSAEAGRGVRHGGRKSTRAEKEGVGAGAGADAEAGAGQEQEQEQEQEQVQEQEH